MNIVEDELTDEQLESLDRRVPAEIIAQMPTAADTMTAPGRVVLCRRVDDYHPYVTWWQNTQDKGCYWGHYFKSLEGAKYDFANRCRKMVIKRLGADEIQHVK